jgi:hypothetical protein
VCLDHKVSYATGTSWVQGSKKILADWKDVTTNNKSKRQRAAASANRHDRGKFSAQERELYGLIMAKRANHMRVSIITVLVLMRKIIKAAVESGRLDAEKGSTFTADRGWRRRFLSRFNLVKRKRTNKKSKPLEERQVIWKQHHIMLRRLVFIYYGTVFVLCVS